MSFTFAFGGNVAHAIRNTDVHETIDTWPGVVNEILEFEENNETSSIHYAEDAVVDGQTWHVFIFYLPGIDDAAGVIIVKENGVDE